MESEGIFRRSITQEPFKFLKKTANLTAFDQGPANGQFGQTSHNFNLNFVV